MDGPNVNMKFFKKFSQQQKERSFHSLIINGSYGLPIVHGNMEKQNHDEVWKKLWNVGPHNSPARWEYYESVTGSNSYSLSFCLTR